MNSDELPFEIGEDYENWEFDLEVMSKERIPMYDSYLYIGEVKKFLNLLTQKTELIFHWDILEIVILTFNNKSKKIEEFIRMVNLRQKVFSSGEDLEFEYKRNKIKTLNFASCHLGSKTVIIYGNTQIINKMYLDVLKELLH